MIRWEHIGSIHRTGVRDDQGGLIWAWLEEDAAGLLYGDVRVIIPGGVSFPFGEVPLTNREAAREQAERLVELAACGPEEEG